MLPGDPNTIKTSISGLSPIIGKEGFTRGENAN
jgi:hypothetical protein